MILLLEEQELPSRREVRDASWKMDSCSELAMGVLTNFSEFYIKIDEMQKRIRVSSEMEKLTMNTVQHMRQPKIISNRVKTNDLVCF